MFIHITYDTDGNKLWSCTTSSLASTVKIEVAPLQVIVTVAK